MSAQLHPLGYESKTVSLPTGRKYRYVDVQPPSGVKTIATALLVHGFPDSAYGWRHQVKGWSGRGIRLIIPDTLGYTGTSQPTDPNEYTYKKHSDDYEALIRQLNLPEGEKVVLIAHDWGSGLAARLAQYKPHLVKGITSLCIPFAVLTQPTQPPIPIEKLVEILPNFAYQIFFSNPESNALIDAQAEKFVSILYASAKQIEEGESPPFAQKGVVEGWLKDDSKTVRSALLSREEFDTIIQEIKAGVGFSAMLNYYRNQDASYEHDKDIPAEHLKLDIPKLIIIPNADPCLAPQMFDNESKLPNIEVARLEGLCGHWVQLEQPEVVERIVGEWVEKMSAKGWAS